MAFNTPTMSFNQLRDLAETLLIEVSKTVDTHKDMHAGHVSDESMIEAVGLMHDIRDKVEGAMKAMKPLETRVRTVLCLKMIQEEMSSMRGWNYTVMPKFSAQYRLPEFKTAPDRFRAMHEYFGTPLNHVDQGKINDPVHGEISSERLKIDWKGVQEHLNVLIAEGKPLPDWVDQSSYWTVADVTIRRKAKDDSDA